MKNTSRPWVLLGSGKSTVLQPKPVGKIWDLVTRFYCMHLTVLINHKIHMVGLGIITVVIIVVIIVVAIAVMIVITKTHLCLCTCHNPTVLCFVLERVTAREIQLKTAISSINNVQWTLFMNGAWKYRSECNEYIWIFQYSNILVTHEYIFGHSFVSKFF